MQQRDCRISIITRSQSTKLKTFSLDQYETYGGAMILELRWVRHNRDDI